MKRKRANGRRAKPSAASARDQLIDAVGAEVVRFQEASAQYDELAAQILALDRRDLPCMTRLLFGGPATVDQLAAALHLRRSAVITTIDRLQRAGYARRRVETGEPRVELTEHARRWITAIWEPLREEGGNLLRRYSTSTLATMSTFMARVGDVQERRLGRLRKWLVGPTPTRRTHLRGGLAPAALRRVQIFVEANLDRPLHILDLAERAGLSEYHFARAFRTSAGTTPRAFVEQRRVERATHLLSQSTYSLADIAIQCGFGTQSRLTTTFKQHTGFTPGEYRRSSSGRQSHSPVVGNL